MSLLVALRAEVSVKWLKNSDNSPLYIVLFVAALAIFLPKTMAGIGALWCIFVAVGWARYTPKPGDPRGMHVVFCTPAFVILIVATIRLL